jgi:class 3 adenylate cyclase
MPYPPTGTVTFLFTDIEGSTRLWQQHPGQMPAALRRHHALLHAAISAHGGYVFQIIGDAFCGAFHTVREGLQATAPTR